MTAMLCDRLPGVTRRLGYVPENIGGHDVLLVEIPGARNRILVRCGQCGRERWTRMYDFRQGGGWPCRNCAAANRSRGRAVITPGPEWRRPVRTPPGILVSADGQVSRNGHLLSQHADRYGRLYVRPKINGKPIRFYVHVLVCEAFHGAKPSPEAHAAHENDVCTDNRAENLAWKTRAENIVDAVRNDRTGKGHEVPPDVRAKISASLTGKTQSAETIAKRSASLTGKERSAETKARMSAAQKKAWETRKLKTGTAGDER